MTQLRDFDEAQRDLGSRQGVLTDRASECVLSDRLISSRRRLAELAYVLRHPRDARAISRRMVEVQR